MSTTIITPEKTDRPSGRKPRLWHIFPCRFLDGRAPLPGDIALCGHRKQTPGREAGIPMNKLAPMERCVVCIDLARFRGWLP